VVVLKSMYQSELIENWNQILATEIWSIAAEFHIKLK